MRFPILTYQPMVIGGNDYAANHLRAFATDLETLSRAGWRVVPLRQAIDAWLQGRGQELEGAVSLCVEDGTDFDFADLPHPTAGPQRSILNTMRDFRAKHGDAQPRLHATSFVIASPQARQALDRACMAGLGWWNDTWWKDAVASGLMHIANHSWDHHHEALPDSFSLGAARGTFRTIDTRERADHEIRQAAEHLRRHADNPGTELFAYPYGESNDYLAREYFPDFGEAIGIRAAFTDRHGYLEETTSRWEIPRLMFGRDWKSPDELRALLEETRPRNSGTDHFLGRRPSGLSPNWPAAAPLAVKLTPPDGKRDIAGIASLTVALEGSERGRSPLYQLHVEERSGLRHTSAVDLTEGPATLRLNVVGHHLPNGPARLDLKLMQGERVAWRGRCEFRVKNSGPLAERVRASVATYGTPWIIEGALDSTHFDLANEELTPWFDRPDALARIERERRDGRMSEAEAGAMKQFVESGYAMLPLPIEESLIGKLNHALDDVVARNVDGYVEGSSQRVRNLHLSYPAVHELWRHPMVMRYLSLIYGVPARPCQTLTYVFGSQQGAHQDTIHLTPFPAGYMCGVWVALEDVRPESGELEVYPGSHRLPRVYLHGSGCGKVRGDDWKRFGDTVAERWRRMLAEGGFGKVAYRPKRGSVLIWHENLMHAGGVRVDASLSRRSIVSHYFADGAIAFYDSTGEPGRME